VASERSRRITRDAAAIGLASGAYAVSFGVLAVTAGLSALQACALSSLVFTGASQFAAVGVIAAGGAPLTAVASALLLAARNTAYGLAVAPLLRGGRLRRAASAQLVIDETTAMARAQREPEDARRAFYATGVAVFVCWNAGTLAGALAGDGIGDLRTYGLDVTFPAAFIALLVPQVRDRGGAAAVIAGAAIALAAVPVTGAGVPVLLAVAGVAPALLLSRGARPR
jgi:4-azaleucine resistance transporter AzlC